MSDWAGIALAVRDPGQDDMGSRLPTHLHPLAGRILVWHVLRAMAGLEPEPKQLFLASRNPLDPAVLAGLAADVLTVGAGGDWWRALEERLAGSVDRLLLVDASAAALAASLAHLLAGPADRVLRGEDGEALAVIVERRQAAGRARPDTGLAELAADAIAVTAPAPAEAFAVRDRAALARAGVIVRDRIVRSLMAGGVTFLLPDTVLVDVDVAIGPDTVIYPGVVLEGQTSIGSETVVGPCCRIIDSQIGSGVELKGWNYLAGTSIRNRAVLEPYVRRGFG